MTKLNSNIQPNVSMKKILKSLKAPKLFRKTFFQIEVSKPERCHNLGIFAATTHVGARLGMIFMFNLYHTVYKIHT